MTSEGRCGTLALAYQPRDRWGPFLHDSGTSMQKTTKKLGTVRTAHLQSPLISSRPQFISGMTAISCLSDHHTKTCGRIESHNTAFVPNSFLLISMWPPVRPESYHSGAKQRLNVLICCQWGVICDNCFGKLFECVQKLSIGLCVFLSYTAVT